MEYLSEADITEINREATLRAGNPFVVLNPASLSHLVSAVRYKYRDKPESEVIWLKAAFLMDFLAGKGHIFADGNKRTAVTATETFLGRNGIEIDTSDQQALLRLALSVAEGKETLGSIARWLKVRVKTQAGNKGVRGC